MTDKPLHLFAFDVFSPAHLTAGSWRDPGDEGYRYTDLSYWTATAGMLEDAGFDGLFFADNLGCHDVYEGSYAAAVRDAAQYPINDPLLVVSAMAATTRHLVFGVTCSLTYEQPYMLARRFSTLDHLTKGRIGWNIVTSYSESAARNLGMNEQLKHADRYTIAEEYMEVVYKLWEGSLEDGAVVRDAENATYIDPDKVHPIEHRGPFFSVPGFSLVEPSPQRTPALIQAGSSARGMEFAARHAEVVFINTTTVKQCRRSVDRLRKAISEAGRDPEQVKIITLLTVVVGETTEEAQARYESYLANTTYEGAMGRFGGWTGLDLSEVDPDHPLESMEIRGTQSLLDMFSKADPDRDWTPREMAEFIAVGGTGAVIVGSPTDVAREIRAWRDEGGIDGINLSYGSKPGDWKAFIEHALPVLREQGLVGPVPSNEQEPVTFREKLYPGHSRVVEDHPAAAYRVKADSSAQGDA